MANATNNLTPFRPYGQGGRNIVLPVDGGAHLYESTLVSQLAATGMLCQANTAGSGPAVGVVLHEQDNSAGSDGDKRAEVHTDRIISLANAGGGDACSEALPLFSPVYMYDDHTVADNDGGATRQLAGLYMGMNEDGTVRVYVGQAAAGLVFNQRPGSLLFSLYDFREVDANSDVGAITANGGILASDTTPILRGNAAETQEISWATGNADPIALQTALPPDFDGTGDVTVELWVNSGTTDAATFTVESGFDGGALVSDSADDTATKSATTHRITATIAAADIPDSAAFLTLVLTPAAHATNAIQLQSLRLSYRKKLGI